MFTAKAAGHGVNSNSDGKDGSNSSGRALPSDAKTVRTKIPLPDFLQLAFICFFIINYFFPFI